MAGSPHQRQALVFVESIILFKGSILKLWQKMQENLSWVFQKVKEINQFYNNYYYTLIIVDFFK